MIFPPDMIPLVRDKRKQQVRYPVRQHSEFGFPMKCRYQPGEVYKVQTTRKWTAARLDLHASACGEQQPTRALAVLAYLAEPIEAAISTTAIRSTGLEITVTAVRCERLGDISKDDIRREGFRLRATFEQHWQQHHRTMNPSTNVWVISFETGNQRHKFDTDRYLKATPGVHRLDAEPHQDYTDKPHEAAERDAPIVPATDLERFAAEGYAGHARRKQAELRRQRVRSATIRLRDAERRNDLDAYRQALKDLRNIEAQIAA